MEKDVQEQLPNGLIIFDFMSRLVTWAQNLLWLVNFYFNHLKM
jgi:hypothetical protein